MLSIQHWIRIEMKSNEWKFKNLGMLGLLLLCIVLKIIYDMIYWNYTRFE